MSVLFYDGVDHMIEKITTLIKGKANNSHKHTKNDITDFPTLGTASSKDVASSGNASATQVVMGNDTRLSDARKASDVYAWAKASTKPTYTKSEVGLTNVDNTSDTSKPVSTAQQTAIDTAYANANKYTDKKVADLIGSAPETMDTLEEVAAAIQENKNVETALNEAIGKKANQTELDTHTGNSTIHITASERTNWNDANTHADSDHAPSNAEENQNAFSSIAVSGDIITADSKTDSLTLEGNNVSLTADNANGKLTIGITKKNVTDALGYTPSEEGGGGGSSSGGGDTPITDIEISNVNGLQNALDSKAASIHTHEIGDVNGLQNVLDSKAASIHTHEIGDVNGLQDEFNKKANGEGITFSVVDGILNVTYDDGQ